jgi:shikimate dehydrogenase
VKGLKAINCRGFNLSMPNKTEVIKYLDKLSPAAELSYSVNTVVNNNGILTGYNTDGAGYMLSLKKEGIPVVDKKMTILGAGGAATAICVQAALDGVKEISIFNRKGDSYSRAEKIINQIIEKSNCTIKLFDIEEENSFKAEVSNSVILVNTTPIGMKPLEERCSVINTEVLRPDLVVSDLIYMPRKTKLLYEAERKGCKVINGLGMLLCQGAKAFELWTGKEMPVEYVENIINEDKN